MSLLGLVVKSRFTGPYVVLLGVSTAYITLQALLMPKLDLAPFALMAISLAALITALAVLGGGPLVLRADLDFLLQTPVGRWALAASLYAAQLLLYWPFFLYVVSMSLLVPYLGLAESLAASLALTALAVSASVSFYRLPLKLRALAAGVLGAWLISPALGWPYAPTSALLGSPAGLALAAAAASALSALALSELRRLESYAYPHGGAELAGREVSFRGAGPVKAVYLLRLHNVSVVGRGAWGGVQYRTGRVGMGRLVLAVSAAAAVYLAASMAYGGPIPATVAVFAASAASASLMGAGAVANERLWISAASLGVRYMRHMLFAIAASTAVFLSPLAAAGAAAWLLGSRYGLGVAIAALGQIPPFASLYAYLFSLVSPYQIKGEHTWPLRVGLRTFLLSLSAFASFAAGAAAVASPIAGLYASAIFYASLLAISLRRPLEKSLESLVLNGFV
ncbi:MAG: hypothetical protein ACP5HD_08685 [Thermoproteus sp.]